LIARDSETWRLCAVGTHAGRIFGECRRFGVSIAAYSTQALARLVSPLAAFLCFSLELGLLAGDLGDAFSVTLLSSTARFRRLGEVLLLLRSLLHSASSPYGTV
jgi:hypothetical protein